MKNKKTRMTLKRLAELVDVDEKTLRRWRTNEGLDLDDLQAVLKRASEIMNRPDGAGDNELKQAKLRKINLESRRIEAAISRESMCHVPHEIAARSHQITWSVFRSALRQLEGFLPEVLAGLSPEAIARQLRDSFDTIQAMLADNRFWSECPETRRLQDEYAKLDEKHLCRDCRQAREDADDLHSLIHASIKAGAPAGIPVTLTPPDRVRAWMRRAEAASAAHDAITEELKHLLANRPD